MNFKSWLRESPLTRRMYQGLYGLKWHREEKLRRENLREKGTDILHQLLDDVSESNFPVFVMYGTLLGLVRSGRLISHDNDIDMGVLVDDPDLSGMAQWFSDRNYSLSRGFLLDGQLVEFSVKLHDLDVDFFGFCDSKYGYGTFSFFNDAARPTDAGTLRAARMRFSPIMGIDYLDSLERQIPIPHDVEQVLRESYGEDWEIPNPEWKNEDTPVRHELENVYATYLNETELREFLKAL